MQRDTAAIHPLFKIMTLQEILFGTWMPPEHTNSKIHLVGISGGQRYKPVIDKRTQKIEGMNRAQNAMFERLKKQIREVSAADMGKKMKITTNHAGILLGELFKLGKVTRRRVSGNGTRFFMYKIKEL